MALECLSDVLVEGAQGEAVTHQQHSLAQLALGYLAKRLTYAIVVLAQVLSKYPQNFISSVRHKVYTLGKGDIS